MAATLGELAVRFGREFEGDPDLTVDRVGSLAAAGSVADCPVASLVSSNPCADYARIATLLHPAPQPSPGMYSSTMPAIDVSPWRRLVARLKHLDELFDRVARLEGGMRGRESRGGQQT